MKRRAIAQRHHCAQGNTPLSHPLIAGVLAWAKAQDDIVALALVGSWARGNPHRRSDVDFMILSDDALSRRTTVRWTRALCRTYLHCPLKRWRNGFYGAVWSRHVRLASGQLIELSFGSQAWASTSPIDSGTRYVVQDALISLYDPQSLLAQLQAGAACKALSPEGAA